MRYPAIKKEPHSSMRNALRFLNLFTMDEPELNVSQLAEKLEVGLSTAHRLASTLIHEGFIVKDPITKNYRLGASILGMGNIIISQMVLCHISVPILERLVIETGETAHIAILKENKVVYLHKIDSIHPVYLLSHAGKQNPVHCTSSGQVILAYQPDSLIEEVMAMGLTPYTQKTITSPSKMKELLDAIRKQGFALSVEELHEGVTSIAAPVKQPSGEIIASVSIAGPTSRINSHTIPRLVKIVKKAAADVSEQLILTKRKNQTSKTICPDSRQLYPPKASTSVLNDSDRITFNSVCPSEQ
jgi:IclR family KDG regulon transcriptional repressor